MDVLDFTTLAALRPELVRQQAALLQAETTLKRTPPGTDDFGRLSREVTALQRTVRALQQRQRALTTGSQPSLL